MSKYLLTIKADTNDADYVGSVTVINECDLEKLLPIIKAIKAGKHQHNWPDHEYVTETPADLYPQLTEKQIDFFSGLLPSAENGTHSVDGIEYYEIVGEKVRLL